MEAPVGLSPTTESQHVFSGPSHKLPSYAGQPRRARRVRFLHEETTQLEPLPQWITEI